jgi:hypothetical protein
MAFAMTMGLALSVQAANTVQVTLTSPTITKTGCEKAGAVTFAFDADTIINPGDWWYFDLPSGVTICQAIDFAIFNSIGGGAVGTANLNDLTTFNAVFNVAGAGIMGGANSIAVGATVGPLSVTNLAAGALNTVFSDQFAFRVSGASGSQRVWFYVFSAGGTQDAVLDTITVGAATSFKLSVLSGALHNGIIPAGIVLDSDGNGVFGDAAAPADQLAGPVPDVNNTLCIDATSFAGDLVFVSFASLNDKFTFTGDAQIAHVSAAVPITLASCKGDTTGDVPIGAQGTCTFDYENPTNYCTIAPAYAGNRMILQTQGGFGGPGDLFTINIYSDTTGVYFGGAANVTGFAPAGDPCVGNGANVVVTTLIRSTGGANVAYAGTTCSIAAGNQAAHIGTPAGAIAGINIYDALWVNLPALNYDTSVIGNGTEADIRIVFGKYPCGTIFTGTRTVGTFVTTCPPAAGTTNLLFPFTPAWDGSQTGWWGGFLIVNTSTAAGTATLTFTDEDGDCATFTTPSIAANGGQWNSGLLADLLTQVTDCTGNTGTFGDGNVNIVAVCNFTFGGGFAFVGNGTEGVGANAYVTPGTGWN